MPSSNWILGSGAKLTVTPVSFMLAISFCESEFSVVTHPASANATPSAASRASPIIVLKQRPRRPGNREVAIIDDTTLNWFAVKGNAPSCVLRAARLIRNALFNPGLLRQTSASPQITRATGETMNAQTAARQTSAPQTPSLPHAKPEALGLSTAGLQRMSDAFKREIDKGTVPGVTVLVARRGQIGWFEALGKQSPTAAAPMAHDTIFRIFSMTKPIVSIGIMMLAEEGRFILSDPVAKFIPEFADSKVG